MLALTEQLAARFLKLEEHDVQALALLKLIDQFSTEADVKFLTWILRKDSAVSVRQGEMADAAREEARAENPDPEYSDPSAWFFIDPYDFPPLDVVKEMMTDQRAALRARVLAVSR
jgi:hypothetical protein